MGERTDAQITRYRRWRRRMNYRRKVSISITGHQTSVTLEPEFKAAFKELAAERNCSVGEVAEFIEHYHRDAKSGQSLSSAVRVYLFALLRDKQNGTAPPQAQRRALKFWAVLGQPG